MNRASNDMIEASDLLGFAGAPYQQKAVDAAVGSIRAECEWHIAPQREDTWTLRTGGSDTLVLRTLRVVEVKALASPHRRDLTPADVYDLGDGVLLMPGGWPDVVTITVQHGFDECPDELLALIADRARATVGGGRVKSESIGGRSVTLEGGIDPATDTVLSRYMLGGRV